MRVATWAIQDRDVLLEEARHRLPPSRKDEVAPALDVVLRAFVARLSGGAVHPGTVDELRATHGAGALLLAAQSVAAALRARAELRSSSSTSSSSASQPTSADELQAERAAISAALDELVELFDPGAGLELDIESAPSGEWAWSGPRPTLVNALDELARRPPPSAEAPAPAASMLLRLRALTASAARALDAARPTSFAGGLVQQRSAPDELLLTAADERVADAARDGGRRLVRAAAAVAHAAGGDAGSLAGAIVMVERDDLVDAAVRAARLAVHAGLVVFDEPAWARAAAGLAPAPNVERAVDPAAAFGTDRWELSALLVRPPLFGRDEEIARLASLLSDDVTSVPMPAPSSSSSSMVTPMVTPSGPGGPRKRDVRFEPTRDLKADIDAALAPTPPPPNAVHSVHSVHSVDASVAPVAASATLADIRTDPARPAATLSDGGGVAGVGIDDRPILISLHGPAGIGKTSLVRAALREAGIVDASSAAAPGAVDALPAAVLWGRADSVEPLAPIAAMLRALADAPAGHPRAAQRMRRLVEGLAERLGDATSDREARELMRSLPLLCALLGAERADPESTLDGDDAAAAIDAAAALLDDVEPLLSAPRAASLEAARGATPVTRTASRIRATLRRAFFLVAEALSATASHAARARVDEDRGATIAAPRDERTVVLVVPGADTLDAASRDVLAFACARLGRRARLILLSSTRLKLPASFEQAFRVERLEVRGLGASAARELVGALLDSDDQSVSLEPLLEKGRGSPLALVHAVRFAVEGGLLRRRDDRWDLGGLDARDIPGRLDRLLRARVERLPADTRMLLSACALLGPVFLPSAAEFVGVRLGASRDDVARALAFLVDTGFLARVLPRPSAPLFRIAAAHVHGESGDDVRPLAFEHPLVRIAALSVVHDAEKVRLHALVADALEATGASSTGGDRAVAASLARHLLLAGRKREALERLTVVARRSVLFDDRAAAASVAEEALALVDESAQQHALPLLLVLEECAAGDAPQRHKEVLARFARAADASSDPRWVCRSLVRVARYNLGLGDAALAEDAAARAAASLTSRPPARDAAWGRLWIEATRALASARAARGDLAGAAAAIATCRGAVTGHADDEALAALDHLDGALAFERGDMAPSLERLLAARGRRNALGDDAGEAACLDLIAALYARRGRLATALALLEQALRLRERIGDDEGRASTLRRQAEVLLLAGDDAAALAASLEARVVARERGRDDKEVAAVFVAVRAHLALGDIAAADALVEAVRRRARSAQAQIEAAVLAARIRLARASSLQGAARERALRAAATRAKEAVALAEKHGGPSGSAALVAGVAVAGECSLLEGDPGAALTFAQQAVELYDALPRERHTALVAVEDVLGPYARVLEAMGDDEEAAHVRVRAVALLEERARHLPVALRERFWASPKRAVLRNAPTKPTSSSGAAQ